MAVKQSSEQSSPGNLKSEQSFFKSNNIIVHKRCIKNNYRSDTKLVPSRKKDTTHHFSALQNSYYTTQYNQLFYRSHQLSYKNGHLKNIGMFSSIGIIIFVLYNIYINITNFNCPFTAKFLNKAREPEKIFEITSFSWYVFS